MGEQDYRMYTGPAEYSKALNILKGMILGITADEVIKEEIEELKFWLEANLFFRNKPPFDELYQTVYLALEDNLLTQDEIEDIIWVCSNVEEGSRYYQAITADLQTLHGIIHGILADNKITDLEVEKLKKWLIENDDLSGHYPYDEILGVIFNITNDGIIDDQERAFLKAFLSEFIDTRESYNLNESELREIKKSMSIGGICAPFPDIKIEGKKFCFTGESYNVTKEEFAEKLTKLNGHYCNNVIQDLDYLIVGEKGNKSWVFSCYGRKVEKAIELRKKGKFVQIVQELDFWDTYEDLVSGIE